MNARWEVWQAKDGWRWRLRAGNGRIVAESGEAYTRRADACRALGGVTAAVFNATTYKEQAQ